MPFTMKCPAWGISLWTQNNKGTINLITDINKEISRSPDISIQEARSSSACSKSFPSLPNPGHRQVTERWTGEFRDRFTVSLHSPYGRQNCLPLGLCKGLWGWLWNSLGSSSQPDPGHRDREARSTKQPRHTKTISCNFFTCQICIKYIAHDMLRQKSLNVLLRSKNTEAKSNDLSLIFPV